MQHMLTGRPSSWLIATTCLLMVGCAGRLETKVRERAQQDFDCPAEQVTVEREAVGAMSGRYAVAGCDRQETYVGRCNLFGMCVAQLPSEIPQPAPTTARADSAPPATAAPTSNAPASSQPSQTAQPAQPSVVSVTLRNPCPNTVKIFFGDKPKFGSGTYSSLSSNSRTSKSMRPGDMIWIVDDSQNGVASASISATTKTVEVNNSCTGLSAR